MPKKINYLIKNLDKNKSPFYVKPIDSSGGKGISLLTNVEKLNLALDRAFDHSLTKVAIIENAYERKVFRFVVMGLQLIQKLYLWVGGMDAFIQK